MTPLLETQALPPPERFFELLEGWLSEGGMLTRRTAAGVEFSPPAAPGQTLWVRLSGGSAYLESSAGTVLAQADDAARQALWAAGLGLLPQGQMRRVLEGAKVIAVVGWSVKPDRPGHRVARSMARYGYRIIPVNPAYAGEKASGERCVGALSELPAPPDIIDVFRKSEAAPELAREAVEWYRAGGEGRELLFWMQDGVVSEEAARVLAPPGIGVVMDDCVLRRHTQWFVGGEG